MNSQESFHHFNLHPSIIKALGSLQFATPTPIQVAAIPVGLAGKDLIGCAETGTGKTAAFCIPILNHLLAKPEASALILAPTRELAIQIDIFWKKLTLHSPQLQAALIMGGAAMSPQIRALSRRPRMIIATPGRLVDHLQRRTARLDRIEMLVLDEADRMLDMGFAPQLQQILKQIPQKRQTLFFTATWAPELDRLTKQILRSPERITVGKISRATSQVSQALVMTTPQLKNDALLDELNRRPGSVLVFARTQMRTDRVARYLADYGVDVNRIHGGRSQGQRNSALSAFRAGKVRVLVATDIAARGIDVSNIAHVINYDLPQCSDDYVHRIGRTGRAGATGEAVSLVTAEDRHLWRDIERHLRKTGSPIPNVPDSLLQEKQTRRPSPKSRPRPNSDRRDAPESRRGDFARRSQGGQRRPSRHRNGEQSGRLFQ